LHERSRSAHDSDDSRNPSASAISSLVPSARTPIITSRHTLSCSRRDLEVDPVDPAVDVVGAGQRAVVERRGLALPLGGEPGNGGGGQTRIRAEELLQRRREVRAGQAVQIEQRQNFGDTR